MRAKRAIGGIEGRQKPGPRAQRAFASSMSWGETFLWIKDKRGRVIPLQWKRGQLEAHRIKREAIAAGKKKRFLTLKSRRQGITTMEQADSFAGVANLKGFEAVTLADTSEKSYKIFGMVDLFYDRLPEEVKPKRKSEATTKLELPGLRSSFHVGTAGSVAYGRGDTIQKVHGSEVAFWLKGRKDEEVETLIVGLTEACSHGIVSLESTANGDVGWWAETCREAANGQNEWTLIFLPWWLDPDCFEPVHDLDLAYDLANTKDDRERWLIDTVWGAEVDEIEARSGEDAAVMLIAGRINWRRSKSSERAMRRLFLQEYPETIEEAFLTNDDCFFDSAALDEIARAGYREPIETVDGTAYYKLPEPGREYVVGADVAEGTREGDYSCAVVIDVENSEIVARYHGKCRPENFGVKLVRLARRYNWALLGVEINATCGGIVLATVHNSLHYPRLFKTRTRNRGGAIERKTGWSTTDETRPIMLEDLRTAIEEGYLHGIDALLVSECRTFVNNGKGKYEHRPGRHDDSVLATAIAWQVRQRGERTAKVTIL